MAKITWVAATSGTWTTPGNWSPSQVPGTSDDVLFDGSGADFSFVGTATVNSLTLDDPTTLLSASGLLTVVDTLLINHGTLSVDSTGGAVLNDFTNQGTVLIASGATVIATGHYTASSLERIGGSPGGRLLLRGTLDNASETLTIANIGVGVQELGTIVGGTVVGDFRLGDKATFDGLTVEGTVTAITGEVLTVNNGLVVRASDGSSPGSMVFQGGSINFAGDQTFSDVDVDLQLYSGFGGIEADGTLTFGATANLHAIGGSLLENILALNGTGPDSAIINDGSISLTVTDSSFHASGFAQIEVNVAGFENNGVLTATHGEDASGEIVINSANFTNTAGGLLSAVRVPQRAGGAAITVSGTTAFTNDGSILANGGSVDLAPTLMGSGDVLITNGGTVDLHNGSNSEQSIIFGDRGVLELENASLFAGTITGVTQNTSILLNVSATAIAYTSNVLTMQLGGGQTFGLHIVGDNLTLDDFIVNTGSSTTAISTDVPAPCFAAGTRVWTDAGETPVETLRIGDRVRLASGAEPRPIIWIGQRHVACATHANPRQVWPVRVAAGAFAPGQPVRDLFLSPDHAIFVDDVLIPVKHLINGDSIAQVQMQDVTYYHVELARHDVILAEGLPVESYLDTGDRTSFANAAIVTTLFPTFGPQGDHNLVWEARAVAPLIVTGPIVRAVRQRLAPGVAGLIAAQAAHRPLTRRQRPHRGTPLKQPQQHPHRPPAF